MTIKRFVDDVLQVPVTRRGNRELVMAIEIVHDTNEHKFYNRLCSTLGATTRQLELSMRSAKNLGLAYMDSDLRQKMFGKADVPVTEYVLRATDYYKENYENEE